MVLFNHATRELTAKIVYYGPGLSGKTTNLKALHERLDKGSVGRLLSLATAQDRTIYFDLLPVELGNIKGYSVRFQLCTVPGQVFYNETRKLVLKGVDGIVFVVDSQWSMLSHNLESYQNLRENLREGGLAPEAIPVVVQYNKRDLPGILSVEGLQDSLGFRELPFIEAVASEGQGVVETFKLASKLTFVDLMRRLQRPAALREARAVGAAEAAGHADPKADGAAPEALPLSIPAAASTDSPFEIGGELPILPSDGVFSETAPNLKPPPHNGPEPTIQRPRGRGPRPAERRSVAPEAAAAAKPLDQDERFLTLEARVEALEEKLDRILASLRRALGE